MSKTGAKIIIVRRKKKGHAAHHGGSWKVAYADFVTAMMAFFMVMWILGMDENLKKSVEGYFSNPVGYKKGYSAGTSPISVGTSPGSVQTTPLRLVSRTQQQKEFEQAGAKIEARLRAAGLNAIASNVEIVMTKAGLRIELAESAKGDTFFPVSSAEMSPLMRQLLAVIAEELRPLINGIVIEGHTDNRPYTGTYTNWELSAARANAARRVLEANGVAPNRVRGVNGLADREPRADADASDARNRRITILLPFNDPVGGADDSRSVPVPTPLPQDPASGAAGMSGAGG
ncbi:MAG: flagellar motor protein MotB [bacterium]